MKKEEKPYMLNSSPGVTSIVTCTPCAAVVKMLKKGTFFMVRHDTCISRLGYQKHEKIRKRGIKIYMLTTLKG